MGFNHAHGLRGSFPGWIPPNPQTGQPPPNWKSALLVLMGLFPAIGLVNIFLRPLLPAAIPPAPALLILNCLTVAFTTWVSMPFLVARFAWWLYPSGDRRRAEQRGLLFVAVVLAAEIALLSLLFALV